MILAFAALGLIVGGLLLARRRRRPATSDPGIAEPAAHADGPARLAAIATRLLPAHRRQWAHAMIAELPSIDDRGQRWRFAAGVAAVAVAPPDHRNQAEVTAAATAAATIVMGIAAGRLVPGLQVFAWALGVLVTVVATAAVMWWRRPGLAAAVTGAVVVTGLAATTASVTVVARTHPAAVSDSTHAYALVFAVVLSAYLAMALAGRAARPGPRWWGLGAAAASCATWIALLPGHNTTEGLGLWLWPIGALAALAASIAAGRQDRDVLSGARAAVVTAILSAPMYFTFDLLRVLTLHRYALTSPYDVAQFPRSGFPDVASFVLSDTLGGGIISVLIMYPAVLGAIGLLGGALGTLRRPNAHSAT